MLYHPNDFQNIIPMVIETSARGERAFDIYSLLLRERIVFLGTGINDAVANLTMAQLLYLEREDPEAGPVVPGGPGHDEPRSPPVHHQSRGGRDRARPRPIPLGARGRAEDPKHHLTFSQYQGSAEGPSPFARSQTWQSW